jgi:predicted flap endonuclease-1-like 5' DNA nuclease
MSKVAGIEGIDEAHGEKLHGMGITTVEALLEKGASPAGRKAVEEATGMSHAQVLRLVNQADLFRIKGIGKEYADLLEASGVDSVPELAQRRADNLHAKMAEINAGQNLVKRLPPEAEVEEWIAQAKSLPKMVTH